MDTLENAELTTIFNITKFLILGIPIFNSKDQDTEGRKTKRRTRAIAKRFGLHANVITLIKQK